MVDMSCWIPRANAWAWRLASLMLTPMVLRPRVMPVKTPERRDCASSVVMP